MLLALLCNKHAEGEGTSSRSRFASQAKIRQVALGLPPNMTPAFVPGAALPTRTSRSRATCSPRMSSAVDQYFPLYQRNRAPTISFDRDVGVSLSMAPIQAFEDTDSTDGTLFSYADPSAFVPNKPIPPSPISWPGGDGRGNEMKGTKGYYSQPNLFEYGPFPDFYKVRTCRVFLKVFRCHAVGVFADLLMLCFAIRGLLPPFSWLSWFTWFDLRFRYFYCAVVSCIEILRRLTSRFLAFSPLAPSAVKV